MTMPLAEYTFPPPGQTGAKPLELLLARRRSVRAFGRRPIGLAELGQLLWAAQGVSDPEGLRTSPSAGALYPLELQVVLGRVAELPGGIYCYRPDGHRLEWLRGGDARKPLAAAALHQDWLADAAAVVAFTAVFQRTARKYGERGMRYVHMEAGHAAQNLLLQAEALALAAVVVGAFDDREVATVLGLAADMAPLSLVPVGLRPRSH
jgi:SagB-type dehydrogenase family enzyme